MARDIAQILQLLAGPQGDPRSCWCPAVDVYRMSDGWILKFDLAGVSPTDIRVDVTGRRLTVRGRRRDWLVEETSPCSAYSMEISYDQFERTIELPGALDQADVETEYREGMLLVRLRVGGSLR